VGEVFSAATKLMSMRPSCPPARAEMAISHIGFVCGHYIFGFLVMGVFIWGAVQSHRNPDAQYSYLRLVTFLIITILFFAYLAESLL
jgi:hypothetical protein